MVGLPQGVGVLERASGVSLVEPIPVIYTREGYRNLVKPRIKTLVAQLSEEEAWVLGGRSSGLGKTDGRELEVAVQRQFLTDYQSTWQGVLADIRVKRIDNMRTAMGTAQVLAPGRLALKRLVVAVADQTRLSAPDGCRRSQGRPGRSQPARAKEAATSATSGLFGSQASSVINAAAPAAGMDPIRAQEKAIEDQFADLRRLVGDGKAGDIDAAVGLINEIFNELVGIQQKVTGQGLKELPPSLAKAKAQAERFNPGVGRDQVVGGLCRGRGRRRHAQKSKPGVGGASALCAKSIPGRYPFSRGSGQDGACRTSSTSSERAATWTASSTRTSRSSSTSRAAWAPQGHRRRQSRRSRRHPAPVPERRCHPHGLPVGWRHALGHGGRHGGGR